MASDSTSTNSRKRKPDLEQARAILREVKPYLERRYGVTQLALFGSLARGQGSAESDLDILVDFAKPPTLFQFIRMRRELSERLEIKVDLVMKSALRPGIGKRILQEAYLP